MAHPVTHSLHVDDPPGKVSTSTISTTSGVVEGVPNEKVDSYTLQVIEQIFPRPASGVQFLALLLRLASIKQMAFDEAAEHKEVAAITVQSIRVLARMIGWSYDTTQKYVLTFCALGLLVKRRHRNQIELYFPLERYQVTPANMLDRIIAGEIKARPKVISFTKQVRRRYLVLLRESTTAFSAGQLPSPDQPAVLAPGSLPETSVLLHVPTALDRVRTLLESTEVDSDVRQHLLQGIERIFAQPQQGNGRLSGQTVDSDASIQSQSGRLAGQKIDSLLPSQTAQSRLSDARVDFPEAVSPLSSKPSPSESTVLDGLLPQNGRLSGQKVDSAPKTVDSEGDAPANVNVSISNILDTLNVNVKGVIEYLRQAFDEPAGKRGYYYKLHKQYARPDAWLAATIETLLGMHQTHTIQDAGRYFFSRCATHHQQGIPPETAELVDRYGTLTYPQLLERLRAPTPSPSKAFAPSAYQTSKTRPAPARPTITLRIPRQQHHTGMREKEMRDLLRTIRDDERTCCILVQPYHQTDGTCALLLDDEMGHQSWVYSLREWRVRLARMKRIPDLFTSATTGERL
jgi:hypothetical protein